MIIHVRFVLDQHADLDFYSPSSLKQKSAGRHVAPLVFALTILWYVLSGEVTKTDCMVFGLNPTGDRSHDLSHSRREPLHH